MMDVIVSVQATPQKSPDILRITLFSSWHTPILPSVDSRVLLSAPSPIPCSLTHHHRNVEDVHLFLDDLRGLLECGSCGLGQLPRTAHGDMEVQCAILQPLLPPVHQRNVRCCARHLCKTRWKATVSYMLGFCASGAKLLRTAMSSEAKYYVKMVSLYTT